MVQCHAIQQLLSKHYNNNDVGEGVRSRAGMVTHVVLTNLHRGRVQVYDNERERYYEETKDGWELRTRPGYLDNAVTVSIRARRPFRNLILPGYAVENFLGQAS